MMKNQLRRYKTLLRKYLLTRLIIARMEDERFKKKFGITDEKLEEISNALLNI
ncbi:hypothetical protein ACF3M2_16565 [Tissierella carlieri]|uniref:hypothetical protein n=1 Tax=Tissierella TaxID=41273 RepID=UPI001913226B|nr:hypothetical protein [Tissierella sp. P1]